MDVHLSWRGRLLAAFALFLHGCGEPPADPTPAARVEPSAVSERVEPVVFELGAAEPQVLFLSGWAHPETSARNGSWVWATARRAELEIRLPHPHFRTLVLACWPLDAGDAPQTVHVALNGRPLRALELETGRQERTIDLPEAVLREGRNTVAFEFRYARSPREIDPASPDPRRLAAAFEFLRFEDGESPLFPPGDPTLFFTEARRETSRVELARETRSAVLASPGLVLKRKLELRFGTQLEVAAAVVCRPGSSCQGPYRFRVQGQSGIFDRRTLWEETLSPEEGRWRTAWLDLADFSGREGVELSFLVETEGPPPEDSAVAPLAFWGEPLLLEPRRRPLTNVILISIDTLRADHLGSYGYERETSPALDALAADGVLFRRAISQAPWTTPAHMSILTSLYPSVHGVNQGWSEALAFMLGQSSYRILSPEIDTLATLLRRRGYRTYAHTGGTTLSAEFGFAQGFDVYLEEPVEGFHHLSPASQRRLFERLRAHRETPFFLFFHTFEAHAPYAHLRFVRDLVTEAELEGLEALFKSAAEDPIRDLRKHLIREDLFRPEITAALYDGGIRATDDFLAELFAELKALDLFDRTLIVVTSDHGEEFGDHSPERIYDAHCNTVYEELLHVPLLLRLPGTLAPGTAVEPPVELIDIAPTVLELLGLPIPPTLQGQSLLPLIAGEEEAAKSWALSEATCTEPEMKAFRIGETKLITAIRTTSDRSRLNGEVEWERLFDLAADPREQNSRHEVDRELLRRMRQELAARYAEMPVLGEHRTTRIDEDVMEKLRALGYVE